MPVVELLYAGHCPNVAGTREQLFRAFTEVGLQPRWTEWQVDAADAPDRVRGYGSPTVLVDGRDVVPVDGSGHDACRIYERFEGGMSGVPSIESIVAALAPSRAPGEPAANDTGRWQLSLAAFPGIGAALLPKIACPACWPAYAGFVSSAGLGFLLDTTYLLPITAIFLATAVCALAYGARERHGFGPFVLGLSAAAGVLIGKFTFKSDWTMYASLTLLVTASIWNSWAIQRPSGRCNDCIAELPEHGDKARRRRA